MKHPHNKEFGKGSILDKCGWVCVARFGDETGQKSGIFSDKEHGMCELHCKRKKA